MAHEDKVVDGHYATDAGTPQAHRQLARQAVKHGHLIAHQVADHTTRAPPRLAQRRRTTFRVAELHTLYQLAAQLVTALVGGIQPELHVVVAQTYQVVHQRTSVAAQTSPVAHHALSINPYNHYTLTIKL